MNSVIFKEFTCRHNQKIGIAELNNPKALNALNLDMIRLLHTQLKSWQNDKDVSAVLLQSTSEKAFCAGGDIVSLYNDIKIGQHNKAPLDDKKLTQSLSSDFFKEEYALDLYIHEYSKPIIVWGNGFVIGGGLGLFAGASHRVVTENTLMAMPEVAIGLYPEVGASWFLNKMPHNIGEFLAITGAFFNASDAQYLGLSNFSIKHSYKKEVIDVLCEIDWSEGEDSYNQVDNALNTFDKLSTADIPESLIKPNQAVIADLMNLNNINDIATSLSNTQYNNKWLKEAQVKFNNASVLSSAIAYQQLQRTKTYSKAQCFEAELNLSRRCCQHKELEEGIRAQLIDKDKNPQWTYKHCKEIEPEVMTWFFSPINSTD
ncbi:enoyl-CoA hydratase/isomerase family protein [Colwellia sp. RE-S-Sl-9]